MESDRSTISEIHQSGYSVQLCRLITFPISYRIHNPSICARFYQKHVYCLVIFSFFPFGNFPVNANFSQSNEINRLCRKKGNYLQQRHRKKWTYCKLYEAKYLNIFGFLKLWFLHRNCVTKFRSEELPLIIFVHRIDHKIRSTLRTDELSSLSLVYNIQLIMNTHLTFQHWSL